MMHPLNLPEFAPQVRQMANGKKEIFDPFRRKFVRLTPEEWVRQHFCNLLVTQLGFPASLIVVEASLTVNRMARRFDILAYTSDGKPCLVIECKAPSKKITQDVFDQVAMYNMKLLVNYLVVTNGMTHYVCHIDHQSGTYTFLKELPTYDSLNRKS